MKKILAFVLALVMVLALTACGDKEPEIDITGTYNATSCIIDGESYSCDGEYVRLDEGGTGIILYMDEEYDITWTLKGDTLTFTDSDGDKFTGTYADGVLDGTYAGMDYVFAMGAGGSKKANAAPAENASTSGFEPVSYEFEEGIVTVVGAEEFSDTDGEPAIRFYYDFTNGTDTPTSAWWELNYSAKQAGFELTDTYANWADDVPEYGNRNIDVYPGVTIRCIEEFSYNPEAGGTVTFIVSNYDEEFTTDFDVADLPGRPADDFVIAPIADPDYTDGWPTEAEFDDHYLALLDSEIVDSYDSGNVIRVYFDFTNNDDEDESCWMATSISAFQDGVELDTEWAKDEVEEDENFDTDIAPGETIRCAQTWKLRSDSPVEIVYHDTWDDIYVGAVYPGA